MAKVTMGRSVESMNNAFSVDAVALSTGNHYLLIHDVAISIIPDVPRIILSGQQQELRGNLRAAFWFNHGSRVDAEQYCSDLS